MNIHSLALSPSPLSSTKAQKDPQSAKDIDADIQKIREECENFKKEPWYFPVLRVGIVVSVISLAATILALDVVGILSSLALLILFATPFLERQGKIERLQRCRIIEYKAKLILSELASKCEILGKDIEAQNKKLKESSSLTKQDVDDFIEWQKQLHQEIKNEILNEEDNLIDIENEMNFKFQNLNIYINSLRLELDQAKIREQKLSFLTDTKAKQLMIAINNLLANSLNLLSKQIQFQKESLDSMSKYAEDNL